jgi:hypothetical protein
MIKLLLNFLLFYCLQTVIAEVTCDQAPRKTAQSISYQFLKDLWNKRSV